jgi:hypothetical protein
MQHSSYVNGSDIHVGTVISIATKTVSAGDELALEFPNNNRLPGKVITASANELEVAIGAGNWRLRPHAPSDAQTHSNLTSLGASFWTVQTKL